MNRYQQYFCRSQLSKALRKQCPDRIPRSGDDGKSINCFSIRFDQGDKPYLLVEAVEGNQVICREWDGNSYSIDRRVNLSALDSNSLSITHYYGLSSVQYNGLWDVVVGRAIRLQYLKIHVHRTVNWLDQYFFNKKKLVTKQRMDLVKFLWSLKLQGQDEVDAFNLMGQLYSLKWILHPEGQDQKQKVKAFLDSLADTGELEPRQNGKYRISGFTLKAIEEYEEQERRHTDHVKIQRWALFLTLAIVVFTAIQAEIIKIPTLMDLTALWK
ncbi:hypothetical protein C7H09_08025 [Marinobacter fuscus]|uniref:Uncharacterized protein n=1 Tax=Marinobacter fuscus TaxID=2109942 RepID=A0A2T1KGP9_9GAMM|nr:hypothetical protein [Marinobacter fuscus]PSF09230.1 hypothetical protein C7H09_08025 [Marinobacter fuscus]